MTLDSQSGVISVDGRAAVVWHLCEAVEAPQLIVGPGSSWRHVDTVAKQVRITVLWKESLYIE